MPVTDPEPGRELQVDFAKMGLLPAGEHKKTCYALIFAACSSRHCYIWLTFHQTTEEVINGFEAAWRFFGGVFPVVVSDNLSSVIDKADPVDPRFNDTF
jgi:transposase